MRRDTLSHRVRLFSTIGLALVWLMAVGLMAAVTWSEQEELFDLQLADTAHVLLPLLSGAELNALADLSAPRPEPDMDEALLWRLVGHDGQVIAEAAGAEAADLPPAAPGTAAGLVTVAAHRVMFTGFNRAGHGLQLAAPLAERREAFIEGMAGFLGAMLVLLPLGWLMVGWLAQRALAPLDALRAQIATRDSSRLDPIDAQDWPTDLAQIAGAANGFMARLSQALEAERSFATNAAHELRTPVAIALAQVQQVRAELGHAQMPRIDALERALQRIRRLVARLLQLARADAGIGLSDQAHDITGLTRMVLADVVPRSAGDHIRANLPDHPVPARIDPDAYAIVLGNLIENALQHGDTTAPVEVTVTADRVVEVANAGPVVSAVADLPRRFHRQGSDGFGLGLHICHQIVAQAGGRIDLHSPRPGAADGFLVRLHLAGADAPAPRPDAARPTVSKP